MTNAANATLAEDDLGIETFFAPIHWGNNDLVPFHRYEIDAATLSWREISPGRSVTNHSIATPAYIHTGADLLENTDPAALLPAARLTLEIMERLAAAASD